MSRGAALNRLLQLVTALMLLLFPSGAVQPLHRGYQQQVDHAGATDLAVLAVLRRMRPPDVNAFAWGGRAKHPRGVGVSQAPCMQTLTCYAPCVQLMSVEEHIAGHHAGDTGPGGWAVGAPCSIAGMFGCSPAASSEEYNRFDGLHPDDGHEWLVAHPFY